MKILVDYLTISLKNCSVSDLFEILDIDSSLFELRGGRNFYQMGFYFSGISIYYGNIEFPGVCLDMSGIGCRTLETLRPNLDWLKLIYDLFGGFDIDFVTYEPDYSSSANGAHISRLDIACDDREEQLLNWDTLWSKTVNEFYICKASHVEYIGGSQRSLYFGSPRSDRRLRIYDKALERGVDEHWIRAELQLRDEKAFSFFVRALQLKSIGLCFSGMLLDYLKFTTKRNLHDGHQNRLKTCVWWLSFCQHAEKVSQFYIGGLDYNLSRLETNCSKMWSSSFYTLYLAYGKDWEKVKSVIEDCELNVKQKDLLKQLGVFNYEKC